MIKEGYTFNVAKCYKGEDTKNTVIKKFAFFTSLVKGKKQNNRIKQDKSKLDSLSENTFYFCCFRRYNNLQHNFVLVRYLKNLSPKVFCSKTIWWAKNEKKWRKRKLV